MKTLMVVLIILLATLSAQSAEVTFGWDPNTESDLAGYNLYQSATSGSYEAGVNAISVTCAPKADKDCVSYTLENLEDGTYFWVITAFDTEFNESDFSNEVSLSIDSTAPDAPASFTVTINEVHSVKVSVD